MRVAREEDVMRLGSNEASVIPGRNAEGAEGRGSKIVVLLQPSRRFAPPG